MKVRVHFDYEDVQVSRSVLIEFLEETGDYDTASLRVMTDEELCAVANDYDVTNFYDNWLGEAPANAIRMEIAHD